MVLDSYEDFNMPEQKQIKDNLFTRIDDFREFEKYYIDALKNENYFLANMLMKIHREELQVVLNLDSDIYWNEYNNNIRLNRLKKLENMEKRFEQLYSGKEYKEAQKMIKTNYELFALRPILLVKKIRSLKQHLGQEAISEIINYNQNQPSLSEKPKLKQLKLFKKEQLALPLFESK